MSTPRTVVSSTCTLFVDHSQIVQLECLHCGIRGTADTRGHTVTYGG